MYDNSRPSIVRPRYDIEKVATTKKLKSAKQSMFFYELDLDGKLVRYSVTSQPSQWRVQSLFKKEPGTIDWIHSFTPDEVFVDVGANVGMYSIYAGIVAGARVYAFEPESQNFSELCRSVFLNQAQDRITPFCAAIGEQPLEVSRLLVSKMVTGWSYHDFGERSHAAPPPGFVQGSVALSLDHLVERHALPPPAHVKIDVDGHEGKVVRGMSSLLQDSALRTVLLECDPSLAGTLEAVESFLDHGWHVNPDQLRLTRDGLRPGERVLAELGAGRYLGNVIFGRRPEDLAFATAALERFTASELERMRLPE